MKGLIITVATSLLSAFTYGMLFRKNEDRIRNWLKEIPKGWLHRRYVMAFVGAVRGKGRATDTATINYIFLIFPISVILFLVFTTTYIEARLVHVDKIAGISPTPQVIPSASELSHDAHMYVTACKILTYPAIAWLYFTIGVVIPFRVLRSRFSYELDRLLAYLRAIATRKELIELMLMEQNVKNEKTLKEFAARILEITAQYRCEAGASSLWLWDASEKPKKVKAGENPEEIKI